MMTMIRRLMYTAFLLWGVEDSVSYYLYAVPEKPIEALSLSDYNHLREILGLSPVSMSNNEFLVHCDTWNYMDGIRQGLAQQPEITFNGRTLSAAETPILTEPMEQYQMAGTNWPERPKSLSERVDCRNIFLI